MNAPTPALLAAVDQELAATDAYLDRLVAAYGKASDACGELPAMVAITQIIGKGNSFDTLGTLVAAIRRLAIAEATR
jgi:hypothetical protein